ncbi:hypothetical protein [Streptomyces syringium]
MAATKDPFNLDARVSTVKSDGDTVGLSITPTKLVTKIKTCTCKGCTIGC